MFTFYSQFSTRTDRKSMTKTAGCSKNPLFFVLKISFIQWGINETITRLSWKFEKNRTSGRFYFFKQKKEHKKWNPLYISWQKAKSTRNCGARLRLAPIIILGKCKALWGKPRTLWRLSQRSTELSCTRFDEERAKKSKAIDEQRCGTFFCCMNTSALARVRLSYEFRLEVFVRYARWRACQDSLSCWTRLALANEKEREREERLKQLHSRSQLAPS